MGEAKEAAIQQVAETKADAEFLERLYSDFGEDDSVAFQLHNFKGGEDEDPELERPARLTDHAEPELEDITNMQRRHAEEFLDPELDPFKPRHSPTTAKLVEEMTQAMKTRLSETRLSAAQRYSDPELLTAAPRRAAPVGGGIDDVE